MENLNFEIDNADLKTLFILVKNLYNGHSFNDFVIDCKFSYKEYYNRNLNDLQKYGTPKTFSQWVNGQIISLT
jgi:hypothetical protein